MTGPAPGFAAVLDLRPRPVRRLPPPAEGVVDLHERKQLVQLRLRQTELRGEGPGVAVEDLEIARRSSPVALIRQRQGITRRDGEKLLLLAEFAVPPVRDQRVGDFAEGLLDGLLVHHQRFLLLRSLRRACRVPEEDRKSTRLNSSHGYISYAV